jgi:hypothetical protein
MRKDYWAHSANIRKLFVFINWQNIKHRSIEVDIIHIHLKIPIFPAIRKP